MTAKRSKYDKYFTRYGEYQWACTLCGFLTTKTCHTSTTPRRRHLETCHKEQFQEVEQAAYEQQLENYQERWVDPSTLQPPAPAREMSFGDFVVESVKRPRLEDFKYEVEEPVVEYRNGTPMEVTLPSTKNVEYMPFPNYPSIKVNKKEITSPSSKDIDASITEMLCLDLLPATIVEQPGFKRLITQLEPSYAFNPASYYSSEKLPNIYSKVTSAIKSSLTTCNSCTLVINETAATSFSIYYLDENLELKRYIICVEVLPLAMRCRIDASRMSKALHQSLIIHGLSISKVTNILCDSDVIFDTNPVIDNMEAIDTFGFALQKCIRNSIINTPAVLAAIKKVKKIIIEIKKDDYREYSDFSIIETLSNVYLEKDVEDSLDRWDLIYLMFSFFKVNKEFLQIFCCSTAALPELKHTEWKAVEDYTSAIKKVYEVTSMMRNGIASISTVIPMLKVMMWSIAKEIATKAGYSNSILEPLWTAVKETFGEYFERRDLICATILDPRFKLAYLQDSAPESKAIVIEEILQNFDRIVYQQDPIDATAENDNIFNQFEIQKLSLEGPVKDDRSMTDIVTEELTAYLREPRVPRDSLPGLYWVNYSYRYPYLKRLYCKLATTPAMSYDVDHFFDVSKQTLDTLEKNTGSETMKKQMYLNCNLNLIDFEY